MGTLMCVSMVIDGYRDLVAIDGNVYRGHQIGTDRPVAVKILPARPHNLDAAMRLGREHPNIVAVLDTRVLPDGRACIVMEHCAGGSLHDLGPMPPAEVIAVGAAIAGALAHAHGQGVVHGDVNPRKVLALRDSYVLAGFGVSQRVVDDIHGLGSTLSTLVDLQQAPPRLVKIIGRCLSEDRFPDAASLRDAFLALKAAPEPDAPGVWMIPAPSVVSPPPVLALSNDPPPQPIITVQPVQPPAFEPGPRSGPSGRRLALLGLISLLLGGLLGVGFAWLRFTGLE